MLILNSQLLRLSQELERRDSEQHSRQVDQQPTEVRSFGYFHFAFMMSINGLIHIGLIKRIVIVIV